MKNRRKIIVWLMLVALLLSEITQLMSTSNQIVWAQEESETLESSEKQEKLASTETSVNQIQSEKTTETSQNQDQTVQSSQRQEQTTETSDLQSSKVNIQPQAGNINDNPGAKVAYEKAVSYWSKELTTRLASAPKLGNYTGATSKMEFTLPVDSAPETSLTSNDSAYRWTYKTNVYFQSMTFTGGDGIVFKGGVYLQTANGKAYNNFVINIERTKPGSNVTAPNIQLVYSGDLKADEYVRVITGQYNWSKVDYLEQGNLNRTLVGITCNLESSDIPSKYSWVYDEWRKASVQKMASNLSNLLKSNYSKLGKNVNDTVYFSVESKVSATAKDAANVQFSGDYFSDLSQFQVDLSGSFSDYVQLERTGSTGTQINYRMKRVKTGDFSGDCSVTISTRHDAEGRKITIYDGALIYWALPMKNIPSDSASANFSIKDERQIWADPVEQTIELGAGTFLSELPDVSKLITNVRLEDGTAISASDYTAQISWMPTFDNMAITEKIVVKLTRKATGAVTTINVPVKMTWGNTIQLRGVNDKTAGAYTLKNVGGSYSIRANYGQDKNYSSNGVHNYFSNTPYHSITLLRGTGNIDQLSSTYYKETRGTSTAKEVVETFGTNGLQYVQLGDVVKIWHKEQWRNSYFKDEKGIKYSNQNEGITYFAVTANGFVPYRLNQLKAKEMTIDMSTTNKELDQKKEDMIDFLGMNGNGLKVSKITQYPDRSKAGTAQGKVLVEETIDGHTHTYEYEVPFKVEDNRQIWADTVEQTIELGTRSDEIPDVSKMLTNVRLEDGTSISSSDYTAEITWAPSFDNMKVTDKISVKITRKSNSAVTNVQVPVKMSWGSTIQLRGISGTVAGAYTLHKSGNDYRIRANYGQDKNYSPTGVHNFFSATPYHSITLLRGTGNIEQLSSTYYKETNGTTTAKEVVETFGTNGEQYVQLGDVVKLWHQEQWRNFYTKDGKEIQYSNKNADTMYFAVTANGFVPYRLNQLKAKEMTINMNTTNEELDQKKADMIDFLGLSVNDLKVSKISQYPDRSKAGTAQGKVLVEETIDGHTHTYEYEVPFKVEDNRQPQADVVQQTITLGTQADELKATNMITNVRLSDGTALSSDEYTTEIMKMPTFDNMSVTEKIEVRLTRKSNNQSVELSVPVKMSWGNTIQLRGEYDKTAGAYTLHKIGDSYYIRASYGENKDCQPVIHWYFGDSPYHSITVLKKGTGRIDQLPASYFKETTGNTSTEEFIKDFKGYEKAPVQLGEVVKLWHKEQGRNSYFKDEKETKYFGTNNEVVYFAVTANGFVPYRLNQLKAKEMTINMNTTDAELDQKKAEMIDFLGLSGNDLKVSKISQYPDRSKAGTAQGKVLVEETIDGQTYTYEYPVVFHIKAPTLTLKTDLKVTNLSRSEEETRVGDELLYVYTLTNDSPIGMLKAGDLSVKLPPELEAESPSDLTVPLTGLAAGQTVTHQLKVKVTEKALDQNPIVKVTGKATNESDIEQDIPEASSGVPGGTVTKIDTSEINITIPSKMNFGADDDKIISPVYKIENNSQIPVEVKVDQFTADANLKGKDLILNLTSNDKDIVLYKDETSLQKAESLGVLDFNEIEIIEFAGSVKDQTEVSKSSSTMRFRFKPTT